MKKLDRFILGVSNSPESDRPWAYALVAIPAVCIVFSVLNVFF